MNTVLRLALLSSLLALSGQAAGAKLVEAGKPYESKAGSYSVALPAEWKYADSGTDCGATRDGNDLNRVFVEIRKHKKPFPALKKSSTEHMEPQELSEDYVANLKAATNLQALEVISNEPAQLGGQPAFRLHLKFRVPVDIGALDYEEFVVGTVNDKGLVLVGFMAPSLHYFAAGREVFEPLLASFHFSPPTAH